MGFSDSKCSFNQNVNLFLIVNGYSTDSSLMISCHLKWHNTSSACLELLELSKELKSCPLSWKRYSVIQGGQAGISGRINTKRWQRPNSRQLLLQWSTMTKFITTLITYTTGMYYFDRYLNDFHKLRYFLWPSFDKSCKFRSRSIFYYVSM